MSPGLAENERQEQLRQAMSSRKLLLVLDDLWDSEQHERRLNFVDDASGSKVLLSSRGAARCPRQHPIRGAAISL